MQHHQQNSFPNFNHAQQKIKIVKSINHTNNLCENHFSFFKEQKFSDICIISSDDANFHAHKIILSAGSDFFMTMFGGVLKESKATEVKIHEVNGDILKPILVFIYTGAIELQTETVEDVLRAANFFQIKALIEECYNFMGEELDSSNCLGIALFAEQHDLAELYAKAFKFVCKHFEQVSQNDEFLQLNGDQFGKIMCNEELCIASEETVFLILIKWMNHDKQNREKYAFKLFSHIRYWLLSSSFIKQHRGQLPKQVEILDMICDWLQWHLAPDSSGLESREFSKDKLVVITRDKMHTYNPKLDNWATETLPDFPTVYDTIAQTNNNLIIRVQSSLKCYDLQSNELRDLPPLNTPRRGFGFAVLNNELYVVGGYTANNNSWKRLVDKFNLSTNQWQAVVPMTRLFTSSIHVAVAGGLLYVRSETYVYCFNPHSNEWTSIYLNVPSISDYGFTNVNEKLFIVGGQLGSQPAIKSVYLAIGPLLGRLAHFEMKIGLCKPKCTSWNNRLIVCGGYDDTGTLLNMIQEFNPDTKKWRTLASLDQLNDTFDILNITTENNV